MELRLPAGLTKHLKTRQARETAMRLHGTVPISFGRPEEIGLKPNPNYIVMAPQSNIDGFRVSGHFDTIKIGFSLSQLVSINTIRAAFRSDPIITPDRVRWKKFFRATCLETSGSLTIQNPTPSKLRHVYGVFDRLGGIASDPVVLEAHFALDWRHPSEDRRIQLATSLPLLVNATAVDLSGGGTPRQFAWDSVSEQGATLHMRPSIHARCDGDTRYGMSVYHAQYNPAVAAPLTTYFGPRGGEHIRIYHKTWDAGRKIAQQDQVVRHEVVLKSTTLREIGITTLASVFSFDARKLAPFFSYEVAALHIEQTRSRKFERMMKLMESGAFAVREMEGAPSPAHPRGMKVTLAHVPMNKRSNSAWSYFWGRWTERSPAASAPEAIAEISEIGGCVEVGALAERYSTYDYEVTVI